MNDGGPMTRFRTTLAALSAALALATGGFFAADAQADDAGTGPDQVIWAKTTGLNARDLLSGVQVGSYKGDNLQSANIARSDSTDCTDCRTVAVAVQAVLVKGSPHTASPTNAAIAINENCVGCTTYAFAYQYIVSTKDRVVLTDPGRDRIAAIREDIAAAAKSELAPDDLNTRLRELSADFRAAIDADLARQDEDIQHRDINRTHDAAVS
jgi:hypothetical protein